jgi:hypothetical protein
MSRSDLESADPSVVTAPSSVVTASSSVVTAPSVVIGPSRLPLVKAEAVVRTFAGPIPALI